MNVGSRSLNSMLLIDETLDAATPFEGSLVGQGPGEADAGTRQLWAKLVPSGGSIQVASEKGRGTTVTIRLPTVAAA